MSSFEILKTMSHSLGLFKNHFAELFSWVSPYFVETVTKRKQGSPCSKSGGKCIDKPLECSLLTVFLSWSHHGVSICYLITFRVRGNARGEWWPSSSKICSVTFSENKKIKNIVISTDVTMLYDEIWVLNAYLRASNSNVKSEEEPSTLTS